MIFRESIFLSFFKFLADIGFFVHWHICIYLFVQFFKLKEESVTVYFSLFFSTFFNQLDHFCSINIFIILIN